MAAGTTPRGHSPITQWNDGSWNASNPHQFQYQLCYGVWMVSHWYLDGLCRFCDTIQSALSIFTFHGMVSQNLSRPSKIWWWCIKWCGFIVFFYSPLLTLSVVHNYRLIVNRTSAGGLASCGVSLKLLEEKQEAERALSSAESNLSSCKSTVRRRGKFFGGVHCVHCELLTKKVHLKAHLQWPKTIFLWSLSLLNVNIK